MKKQQYSIVVYDKDHHLMGARISADGQWRFPPVNQLPTNYITCLKYFEDKRFNWHPGVDIIALSRAFYDNVKTGSIKSGGSTITMQLARLLCKHQNRNLFSKIIETWYALGLELKYSKYEILCLYASFAPYGGNVVGFDAALWRYFEKTHREITWAEAALLAVLPNQPSWLHLKKNRPLLLQKRNRLLKMLSDQQMLDQENYQLAILEPLPEGMHEIPQMAMGLIDVLKNKYPGQHHFQTSVDLNLQIQLNEIVKYHCKILRGNEIHNTAVLVVENHSGKVKCYIPNTPDIGVPVENSMVNNIHALRSSGSILKPLLYASAIDLGLIHSHKLMPDIPTSYGDYTPENFSKTFYGMVTAKQALQWSLNIPAVRLLKEYGLFRFHEQLHKLGFTSFTKSPDHYGLSLVLGGGEVSVWELANAYSNLVFQFIQYQNEPDKRKRIFRKNLSLLEQSETQTSSEFHRDVLKIGSVYQMLEMMKGSPEAAGDLTYAHLNSSKNISWKTGTSFGFKDAWCVGLSGDYTIVVWQGNSNGLGRPGLLGLHTAAPLLFDLANSLKMHVEWKAPVDQMHPQVVCKQSGLELSQFCPEPDTILCSNNSISFGLCNYHKLIYVDPTGQHRVTKDCEPEARPQIVFSFNPVVSYFYKNRPAEYKEIPPWRSDCSNQLVKGTELEIIYPIHGSLVYLPVDLDRNRNKIIFKATHKEAQATLFWFLDGTYIGNTKSNHELPWTLPRGKHKLSISDDRGNSMRIDFSSRHSNDLTVE